MVLDKTLELRIKLVAATFKTHTYLHFHMCACVQLQSLSLTGKAVNSPHGGFSFFSVHICALLGAEPVKLWLAYPRACDTLSTLRCARQLCAR